MFTSIIGFMTPYSEKKTDRTKFIKAMVFAIILDFLIYYTLIKWTLI